MGFVGELTERYGPLFLMAGIVYTILALALQLSIEAGGAELETSLVPPIVGTIFMKTWEAWSSVSKYFQGGEISFLKLPFALYDITVAIVNSLLAMLSLFVTATFAFLIIAVQLSRLLPYPFNIVSVLVWIAATFIEIIVVNYVINVMYDKFIRVASAASSIFSRYVPV